MNPTRRASTTAAVAAPSRAERQPRLTPAATTMVRASTISTELAPNTARMRMRVEVVCMVSRGHANATAGRPSIPGRR